MVSIPVNEIKTLFLTSWFKRFFHEHYPIPFNSMISFQTSVDFFLLKRSPQAYCLFYAAYSAKRLGIKHISAMDFGVAHGKTFFILEKYIEKIEKITGVKISLFGFDTGKGLPEVTDSRYLPHWFHGGLFEMNQEKLEPNLRSGKLIIGDVKDTIDTFFNEDNPPPYRSYYSKC